MKTDFVNIRLTDAGRAFAGPNGSVRIANAHMSYRFTGSATQRVLTSEWTRIFALEQFDGNAGFEIVDAQPLAAPIATKTETITGTATETKET